MILTDLSWAISVLLTKCNVDTRGIGMLEVLWKVVEAIIDTRIKMVVKFHDVLNIFCASRGTGMAIMELKMAQELVSINQDPLFLVFLYLWKSYNTLDCVRLLQTFEGYGEVLKMRGILAELWENQEVVTR